MNQVFKRPSAISQVQLAGGDARDAADARDGQERVQD